MKKHFLSLILILMPLFLYAQRKARATPYSASQVLKFLKNHPTGYGAVLMSFSVYRLEPQNGYTYELFWQQEVKHTKKRSFRPEGGITHMYSNSFGPYVITDSFYTFYRLHIMPVGKYNFYNFGLFDGLAEIMPKTKFNMPFEVLENKINYIGDFLFLKSMHKTIFGKMMDGGIVIASNRMPIDSSFLVSPKSKFNTLDFTELIVHPPYLQNAHKDEGSCFFTR